MEFDLPPGVAVLGKPRLKAVAVLIPPETQAVAEHLRNLAEHVERGAFASDNAPVDQAAVLFLRSTSSSVHVAPIRISANWLFEAVQMVYRQMVARGFKSRFEVHGLLQQQQSRR
jgi:hypothetical protein